MITHVFVILLTGILMIMGLVGAILPVLPGAPLILIGAFIYAWHTGFISVSWGTLLVLLILTVLSHALDTIFSLLGAKKYGASRWGIVGAFLGGLIGFLSAGILGIIIGPFLGALLLELIQGQGVKVSLRVGMGTLIGLLGGAIGKVIISIIMIGIFLVKIIS